MNLFYAIAAICLLMTGLVIGVTIVVCLGIHREEVDRSMTRGASTSMTRGVRRLTGLSVRGYSHPAEPDHRGGAPWPYRTDSNREETIEID